MSVTQHGLLDLDELLGAPQADTAIHCCGPGAPITEVGTRTASWSAEAVHVERFAPREGALDGASWPFEVRLARSGITVTVGANE